MKTHGFYLGTALMLVICFCAIVPAQAAEPAEHSAYMRGNAKINTLSLAGYDVTSLRTSLDAAQSAAQSGDAETARTAFQELRAQVREAMQSGILSQEQLLQHRETIKNRMQNAVTNGNRSQWQSQQRRQAMNA